MKMKEQIKHFFIGIGVFLLYFIVLPYILKFYILKYVNPNNKVITNISLSLAEIFIFLVLFFIFRKTIIEDFKKFKKDYKKNLDIGLKYYFIGFLVMFASNLFLSAIFGSIAANESANREYLKMYPIYSIVAMIIVGPSVEEIVFRLGFRKAFKKFLPYAIFTALLFAGIHVSTAYKGMAFMEIIKNWYQILYVIPYGALGFSFAKAYYETDNIWTTMTIHTLHNAFTIFLIICVSR